MFKLRDVMTKDPTTVRRDAPIYDAMRTLVDQGITGMPVVEEDMTLVGVVSEKDMLRLLYEESLTNAPVEEFMSHDVVAFDQDDELIDACECLINNHFRRVPVLADGKLAGIVSRADIIRYILKLRKLDGA
jgi:tRNA nucleotidyltransferase (CCA-adding enzyme)